VHVEFATEMRKRATRLVWAVGIAFAAAAAASAPARADDAPACPSSTGDAYAMTVRALTGAANTDVELRFAAAAGCADVDSVDHVQLKTFTDAGNVANVRNVTDTKVGDGVALVALPRIERGRRIEVEALVQTGKPARTYVLRRATTSRLRPDLVVAAVHAPLQTLTTRPVDVAAEIAEVNGDTAATATVSISSGIAAAADPVTVDVPAGGRVSVTFPAIALTTPTPVELTVVVGDGAPTETDATNNTRSATVDVTLNELARSRLLVQSLGGYGFQFNQHVYAPITSAPPASLPNLESKVKALEPQLVRIFYNDRWEERLADAAQNLDSFRRTVELANGAGATIVVDYQAVDVAKLQPDASMSRFADVLADLVQARGLTGVRWVTVGNEPNSTALTLDQYNALCRALHTQLAARGLSGLIGLVGGDLVEGSGTKTHRAWFDYMVANMNDVFDAWAEHVYWQYDSPARMQFRLKDIAHLVHHELPENAVKPTFITEFGVRGSDSCGTKPKVKFAYYSDQNCTELRRMSIAGFQKLWFSIVAAQLGFDGSVNWDAYWARYDLTSNPPNQSFWMIGPPSEDFALYPSYHAMRLLLQTTRRGWEVLGVDPWTPDDEDASIVDQPGQELVAYRGAQGELTILGLDTHGGSLTAATEEKSAYSIGGLPPSTTFNLALWNATGDGEETIRDPVTTNAAGVARFDVPLQAAFALTTVPVS
jgi:hypothetical protein